MAAGAKIDLPGYKNLKKRLKTQNASGSPFRKFNKQMGTIYLAFTKKRFSRSSRGGGDWKAIEPETAKTKGSSGILVDDGFLIGALSVGTPGNRFKLITNGIEVGYSDKAQHPNAGMSYAKLAEIHQQGMGDNPERIIFVPPDKKSINLIMKQLAKAVEASTK